MFPAAKFYKDFRQMFAEMGDKIDAVGIDGNNSIGGQFSFGLVGGAKGCSKARLPGTPQTPA